MSASHAASMGDARGSARAGFITRTYLHLFAAVMGFVAIEVALFSSGLADGIARAMLSVSWLLVLGAFMVVAWLASHHAHRSRSRSAQYVGLVVTVVAEAIFFVPLLYLAERSAPGVIESAAAISLAGFSGLTAIAFITRRDFSFLRGFLWWGGLLALGLIVVAIVFGFRLGPLFSLAMVGYAGAAILYDTSKVIHRFGGDRHAAAALELFTSVALLFWYVIRLSRGMSR